MHTAAPGSKLPDYPPAIPLRSVNAAASLKLGLFSVKKGLPGRFQRASHDQYAPDVNQKNVPPAPVKAAAKALPNPCRPNKPTAGGADYPDNAGLKKLKPFPTVFFCFLKQ